MKLLNMFYLLMSKNFSKYFSKMKLIGMFYMFAVPIHYWLYRNAALSSVITALP